MRITAILLAILAATCLAGCNRQGNLVRAESPRGLQASATAQAQAQPNFAGAWARTAAECRRQPWRLSVTRVTGPGGVDCGIEQLDSTLAGYTAHSTCTANGVATPGRIVLTVGAAQTGTLTLSQGPFGEPVSLVRCPAGAGTLTPAG